MGIYPTTKVVDKQRSLDGSETWEEHEITPGLVRRRFVTAKPWIEERTDCFCCSCPTDEYGYTNSDVYCRNHGFAGERPCERHGMPGTADEDGHMPVSVQAFLAAAAAAPTGEASRG